MTKEKFDPDEKEDKCDECRHDKHDPGECEVLHIYNRGPNDPPGNQRCLCGYVLDAIITCTNEGWEKV